MAPRTPVYLESAAKRSFAGALDWPGWCRAGRGDDAALAALFAAAPRYAAIVGPAGVAFEPPAGPDELQVVERLAGGSGTEFGAPSAVPAADAAPIDDAALERLRAILRACWTAFDRVALAAEGRPLRTGPRGGGRDLDRIRAHLLDAAGGYLSRVGRRAPPADPADPEPVRAEIVAALEAAARGEVPEAGPRGGRRWSGRYLVRREAWHVLDHAWEIEDRAT